MSARLYAVLSAIVCVWLLAVSVARAQYPTPTYPDITFATYSTTPGARDCKLDVHIPVGFSPPYPVLVYVHGGGWSTGGRKTPSAVWQGVLAQGIAVVTIDYRLTSQPRQFGTVEGTRTGTYIPVTWPAQIHDCKAAVRWVRGNAATYGFDALRIGVYGSSAGGHLVAAMGTMAGVATYERAGQVIDMEGTVGNHLDQSSNVIAVADYFGPTDILNMQLDVTNPNNSLNHDVPSSPESNLIGATAYGLGIGDIRTNQLSATPPYPLLTALTISANPITFVRAQMPPMFIAHGSNDTSVPTFQSHRLHNALQASGNISKLTVVQGAGHGVLGSVTDAATTAWLVGVLKGTLVCPSLTVQPVSQVFCTQSSTSILFATSASGSGPMSFQWRRNGVAINSTINPSAATAQLVISAGAANDAGNYDCVIANPCGSIVSSVATLTVCPANINCDTALDFFDYLDFVAAFSDLSQSADFNADTVIDFFDYLDFVAAFSAGC